MTELQPVNILQATNETPDTTAVRFGDTMLTWSELERRARKLATALYDLGIRDEERCGVLAFNRLEWPELYVGTARAGSRLVMLNWHLKAAEIRELLIDSGCPIIVVDDANEAVAKEAAGGTSVERIVVFGDEYEDWIGSARDDVLPDHKCGAPLMYTGGTTGRSKGVTRSDQNRPASSFATTYSMWGELTKMPRSGVAMLTTPAYHALGNAVIQSTLARRHPLTILERFDPETTIRTISEQSITTTAMVPTQFIRLLKLDDDVKAAHDVSSIEWVLHTAAPCPRWAKRGMIDWFGPAIVELYGASEGVGPVISTSQDFLDKPGTVGKASAAVDISIVDDEGNDLPPDEIGTIYARRQEGAPEYEGDPEKTAAMRLPDGRFTVGDVGWLDDDGYLFLADRRVDLILVGGSNVYSAEIEGTLSQHPDIADVAVFGIPHTDMGQEIKAVVEAVPGQIVDGAEVITWAAERMAKYKVPKTVDVPDSLPREESGKLKKRFLRDPYWEGLTR